jgi:hypothetical protein
MSLIQVRQSGWLPIDLRNGTHESHFEQSPRKATVWRPRLTLWRLMLFVAITGVFLGAIMELPRIGSWCYRTQKELELLRSHVEVERRVGTPDWRPSDPLLAIELAKSADNQAWIAARDQPSLVGISCVLGVLACLPILIYGVALRTWKWMSRKRIRVISQPAVSIEN